MNATSATFEAQVPSVAGDSGTINKEMGDTMAAPHIQPTDLVVQPDWEAAAACRSAHVATDVFFSEDLGDIAQAKAICATCPVLAPCLEGALRRREPWGVWGGQLFLNGKMLATKRRRGRPPKNPRPGDSLPVVPIPEHLVELASA